MSARFSSSIARFACKGLIAVALMWLTPCWQAAAATDRLTVHEWGTFTALQDEQGRAIGGINVDDEPLPGFVHDLNPALLPRPYSLGGFAMLLNKGVPQQHPDVTMRLETPVIYFHLPPGAASMKLDVDVALHGGWLSQFYPNADADVPGLKNGTFNFGKITPQTTGRLAWHGLTVGSDAQGPKTDSHVWLAPRQVKAASVTTAGKKAESEKYLFYRGVGKLPAPLEVVTDTAADRIEIHGRFDEVFRPSETHSIGPLWLVQVRADGQLAYRTISVPSVVTSDRSAVIAQASSAFSPTDFASYSLANLQEELMLALEQNGLYADEAAALLQTWNQSYFRSPGLRLFFLVPHRWTNHYLPLTISVPADIQRAMIGRIELISSQQRASLKKLSEMTISDPAWVQQVFTSKNAEKFLAGPGDFAQLGIKIPPDYQTYLDLGRFRNALMLDQVHRRPTPALQKFIAVNNISAFSVPADTKGKQ